jgi:hypothetical protein
MGTVFWAFVTWIEYSIHFMIITGLIPYCVILDFKCMVGAICECSGLMYTPLAMVYRARKTPRVSTTATIVQIPAVSSKEGAVIGTVLSTQKFHRGHH